VRTHAHLDAYTCDNHKTGQNWMKFTDIRNLLYNLIVPTPFDKKSTSRVPVFFVAHSGLFSISKVIENVTEYY